MTVASRAVWHHHRASGLVDYSFDCSRGAASDGRETPALPPTTATASRPPNLTRIPPPQPRPPKVGVQRLPSPLRAYPIALWVAPTPRTVAASLSLDTSRRCRRVGHRHPESPDSPSASPRFRAPPRTERPPRGRAEASRPASKGPSRRPRVATAASTSPWLGRCRQISLRPFGACHPCPQANVGPTARPARANPSFFALVDPWALYKGGLTQK